MLSPGVAVRSTGAAGARMRPWHASACAPTYLQRQDERRELGHGVGSLRERGGQLVHVVRQLGPGPAGNAREHQGAGFGGRHQGGAALPVARAK